MADAEFEHVRSFGIDNGELDGLSPENVFVLGYELAMVDAQIGKGEALRRSVHAENSVRIESELKRLERQYEIGWMSDDASESWLYLEVEAAE